MLTNNRKKMNLIATEKMYKYSKCVTKQNPSNL